MNNDKVAPLMYPSFTNVTKSICLIITCLPLLISGQDYPQDDFRSPVDIPIILSGTFGELRGNHYHAGIDIKTNGTEGLNVYAAADGEIVRIAVSPYGYGKALYIRHRNGYTTVYAHLKKFNPAIAAWVEDQQYQKKSFAVNLFPTRGSLPVNQGDIIALSGNSGGSGGPHLHFEIRDSRTEEPINPLLFGFVVPDNRPPEVKGIYAYPLDGKSHLNQQDNRLSLAIRNLGHGRYAVRWPQKAAGNLGFGIAVHDRQDGAWNLNGPYRIVQYVNGEVNYEFVMERFAFSETRYLNAHIDYELYDCCSKKVNRTWVLPGNHLRAYNNMHNSGIIRIEPGLEYDLHWEIFDVAGNVTRVTAKVIGTEHANPMPAARPGSQVCFDEPYRGSFETFSWNMEANTFYEDARIDATSAAGPKNTFGPSYTLGQSGIAIHKHFSVTLPIMDVPARYRNKAVVVSWNNDGSPNPWGGEVSNNGIVARVRTLGTFSVMVDTAAPVIRSLTLPKGGRIRGNQVLAFKATDDLTGVTHYSCTIDGNWHLMEYDAKNDRLELQVGDGYQPGRHKIEITVRDDCSNTATWDTEFELLP